MGDPISRSKGPDFSLGVARDLFVEQATRAGHVAGEPVLVSRRGAHWFAVDGSCTHYGGPLGEGLVTGDTVRCPWHHACFNLCTGTATRAPAFDPLGCWRVEVEEDRIFVRSRIETPATASRPSSRGSRRIVIVGGGAAGFAAAEMLRRLGHGGPLAMLSADRDPPYDRPNLSKDYLAGTADPGWMPLKDEAWYRENGIDLRLETEVIAIDTVRRTLAAASGDPIGYDALLLATGAEPVRLDAPGLEHAHLLRSFADARAILAAADGKKNVAIIGASFIALEAAAALAARGLIVHVVAPEQVPMQKVLGPDIGAWVRDLHESKGVKFHLGRTARSHDGRRLMLDDGSAIDAELVVVGIGVRPRSGLAEAAGIATGNGILVDRYLATSAPRIYAAGDVACYPGRNGRVRIEHWVLAQRQGQIAARNLLGEKAPFEEVPFFWSRHYDRSILYVGHAATWDETRIDGSLAENDCTVRFYVGGQLVASASIGRALENLKEEARLEQDGVAATRARRAGGVEPRLNGVDPGTSQAARHPTRHRQE